MKLFAVMLVLAFSFITCEGFSQENTKDTDCRILKKGKFLYLDAEDKTAYIEMEGDYQIEKSGRTNYFIESSVEWISECTYIMTMTKITIPDFPFSSGDKMRVDINKVDGDIIYYTSTVKGVSWKGRFKKIRK